MELWTLSTFPTYGFGRKNAQKRRRKVQKSSKITKNALEKFKKVQKFTFFEGFISGLINSTKVECLLFGDSRE